MSQSERKELSAELPQISLELSLTAWLRVLPISMEKNTLQMLRRREL